MLIAGIHRQRRRLRRVGWQQRWRRALGSHLPGCYRRLLQVIGAQQRRLDRLRRLPGASPLVIARVGSKHFGQRRLLVCLAQKRIARQLGHVGGHVKIIQLRGQAIHAGLLRQGHAQFRGSGSSRQGFEAGTGKQGAEPVCSSRCRRFFFQRESEVGLWRRGVIAAQWLQPGQYIVKRKLRRQVHFQIQGRQPLDQLAGGHTVTVQFRLVTQHLVQRQFWRQGQLGHLVGRHGLGKGVEFGGKVVNRHLRGRGFNLYYIGEHWQVQCIPGIVGGWVCHAASLMS